MDVEFATPRFKINVAEGLKIVDLQVGEFDKYATIPSKAFEVLVALPIQIGTHLLNLKIGHITYTSAQSAFMSPGATELKTFNQSSRWEHLAGYAYNLGKADVTGKDADNMRASCNPDNRLVLFGI